MKGPVSERATSGGDRPGWFREMLREYGEITLAAVREYLPEAEPRRHLYDLVADYPRRGGETVRSALLIATARAFGARLDDALRSAVVVELLHNAMLIHRDIEYSTEARRGRPALHIEHGVPLALNAGDATTLLSLRPLIENSRRLGPWLAWRVIEETDRMARISAEGHALELGWIRDNTTDLDETDYLGMVLKKTCWFAAIYPIRVGALIGARGGADLEGFIRFGFFLGSAFQIQQDAFELENAGAGVPRERTLMLIRLFELATSEERSRLSEVLDPARGGGSIADGGWIRRRVEAYGCVDYARQIAHGLAGAALHEYSLLFGGLPDSRDKRFLEALVTWTLERG